MKIIRLLIVLLLLPVLSWAQGEQKQVFGNTEVHYMMLNSKDLNADVAGAYGIQRSGKFGFIMVSVLEHSSESQMMRPVPAIIEARVINLIGQVSDIELEEIREQGGLYYVGTFKFYNEDIYRFEIDVKTQADQKDAFSVKHRQRMYFE